jgi:hypothetical protein
MDIFVPILKVDAQKREVYGVMAEEVKDKAGEIFDYETSKPYVKAWSEEALNRTVNAGQEISLGNVRSQHSNVAAGKLVDIQFDDKGKRIPIIAKIVDDNEWKKVEEGIYTGFSIGGSYVKRWSDGAAIRYTAKPNEVSIVDNPCMAGAAFVMVKANGAFEYRGFSGTPSNPPSELSALIVQVRAQMDELTKRITALAERRAAATASARFNANGRDVERSDEINRGFLNKALANGTRIDAPGTEVSAARFQPVETIRVGVRTAPGGRFVPDGFEKNDVAAAELEKALANPKRGSW